MPSEGWITVPGKGKRYRMADGSYRMMSPDGVTYDLGGVVNQALQAPLNALNRSGIGQPRRGMGVANAVTSTSLLGIRNSGAAPWEAPARAQEAPPVSDNPYVSPFAGHRQANLDRIKADPQFGLPGPGQGAPAPVVSPVSRARAEALNTASQQGGGPNLSKPIVPTEAEAQAQREFAAARDTNPLASVPEILDQRSEAYANREGISQWLKAMQSGSKSDQEIARRFLAKQNRQANPVQDMPAGTRLMGGDGSEQGVTAYDAKRLEAFERDGAHLQAVENDINANRDIALRPRDMERNPTIAPALTAEGTQQAYQAAINGFEFAPKTSALMGNLAFSPLPEANQSQLLQDKEKSWRMQLSGDLVNRFKGQALAFNASAFGRT